MIVVEDYLNILQRGFIFALYKKIQIIFVKNEDELPVFEGSPVWGHAGAYITVFVLEGEETTVDGRRAIIGRIFHEIRARSTRAKNLFRAEFDKRKPATVKKAAELANKLRKAFERKNIQIFSVSWILVRLLCWKRFQMMNRSLTRFWFRFFLN